MNNNDIKKKILSKLYGISYYLEMFISLLLIVVIIFLSVKLVINIFDINFMLSNEDVFTYFMENAMSLALKRGSSEITVLGATGTRMDHVLGSISNLTLPLKAGVPCSLVDAHNRIRMIHQELRIKKEEQYGKYVSILAFGGAAEGITLEGFYYPLRDYTMEAGSALGISNEIVEEEAGISFRTGTLLVIESRD